MNDNESYNNIVYTGPSGAERATLTSMIGSSNDKLDGNNVPFQGFLF